MKVSKSGGKQVGAIRFRNFKFGCVYVEVSLTDYYGGIYGILYLAMPVMEL